MAEETTEEWTVERINRTVNEMYETLSEVPEQTQDPSLEFLLTLATEACDLVTRYTLEDEDAPDCADILMDGFSIAERVKAHVDRRFGFADAPSEEGTATPVTARGEKGRQTV